MHDQYLYESLLRKFVSNFAQLPEEFREKLEQDDLESASRMAHTLRGSAGNIGAKKLQDLAAALELQVYSSSDQGALEPKFEAVVIQLNEVLQALGNLPSEMPKKFISPASSNLGRVVDELLEMTKASDMAATDYVAKLESVASSSAFAETIRRVIDEIEQFDFESASRTLEVLSQELQATRTS